MLPLLAFLLSSSPADAWVVGGTPVEPGVWRDAVAVLSPTAACTGTLITPDVVLTAGHCIATDPTEVIVDTVDYGGPGGEAIAVARSLAYPGWQDAYDVGVVVLDHPAEVKPRAIAAACSIRDGLVPGRLVQLVGFGLTTVSGTGSNSTLHEARIAVVDATCSDDPACVPAIAPGGELTAGGQGSDACFGDSGGPIYLDTPAGPALVGVVSRATATAGPPCGDGGVYVRADRVIPWIQQVTHEAVERTTCAGVVGAAGDSPPADEPTGGCAAGGGAGGPLAIALGVVAATGRNRRRPRAAQTA